MLISQKHKKVLLNVRNIERITTCIPTARTLEYKGRTLVAVPHRDEEIRILKNLGIEAPAPINYYYPFPGRHRPFAHQRETAAFMTLNPHSFCLNGMGSGKTISMLWAFDYLRKNKLARRLLVISPLSTLERTWADEIFQNFDDMTCAVLHGTKAKRLKLLANDFDVYVINHDGIKSDDLLAAIKARGDIDCVIVDECAEFRNSGTDRWKYLNKLIKGMQYVWALTGTPTPKDALDSWAQIRLINPGNVSTSRNFFRDRVQRQQGPFKWVDRDDAAATVASVMQPAIRFSREECIDLPPTTYITRHAEMTGEQEDMYKTMLTKLAAEYEGGTILAVNEAVKVSKLLQIAAGVVYDNSGETVVVRAEPRMQVTLELIESAAAKAIVFVPFTAALNHVAEYLRKNGKSVEVIHGQTAKGERDRIFGAFQKLREPNVLVANPAAMSHGLTLTAADLIVWFSPTNNGAVYQQANMRIVRPGQKRNTMIAHIEGCAADRKVYDRLRTKEQMQGLLLDLMA
jgi:SNF2 family DNA or RNA helicase